MRRTRGFAWYHFLFAIPALALAFGVTYFLKKSSTATTIADLTAWTKPSFFKADGDAGASRGIASAHPSKDSAEINVEKIDPDASEDEVAEADEASAKDSNIEPIHAAASKQTEARVPASGSVKGECTGVEYRGDGPDAKISKEDWDRIVIQFSEVKNGLSVWLGQHHAEFSEKTANFMQRQINLIRVRKPPVSEQPDLAWRGIGVYVSEIGGPAIHVSPGFLKLAKANPARSKFELARLAAQSWSPCELQKADVKALEAWNPLLGCLGVQETQACAAGSTSESGWAISSALAAVVSPPGCKIPAFHSGGLGRCLSKISMTAISQSESNRFERTIASASRSVKEGVRQ